MKALQALAVHLEDLNVNDDLGARPEALVGIFSAIQERYGYQKDQVRREVDEWYTRQRW